MFSAKNGLRVGSTIVIDSSGNIQTTSAKANALTTARTISLTGIVTGSVSTDLSGAVSIATTLTNTAVTPGTYTSVTVGPDGRITAGTSLTTLSGYGITDAQPLNANLTSISALSANAGILVQSGANTFLKRSLDVNTGLSILNATGQGGNPTISLDAGLVSIAGLTGAGVVTATATDNFAMRAIGVSASTDIPDRAAADTRYLQLSGGTMTGNLVLAGDPSLPLHPATKQYVDAAVQGLDVKASVKAATTANLTLASPGTSFDGVTPANGDRILVKNQTTQAENGIYVYNGSGASLTRALDMDAWTEVPGAFVFVEQGTNFGNTGWTCTSDTGGTLGSTAITWVQFSAAGAYTANGGITATGNNFSLTNMAAMTLKGNDTGSTAAALDLTVTQVKTMLSLDNVENKSSASIRGELTSTNVTTALAYTPANKAGDTFTGAVSITGAELTTSSDGFGVTFNGGARIYKKVGTGLVLRRHTADTDPQVENNAGTQSWTIYHAGNIGTNGSALIGYTPLNKASDTMGGVLNLATGTTSVAPLRFTAGTNLSTPVSGAVEWNGTNLFITNSTPTRKQIAYIDDTITGAAARWTNARSVTFATGDVTGAFSIDGSANVGNVNLTIGANKVSPSKVTTLDWTNMVTNSDFTGGSSDNWGLASVGGAIRANNYATVPTNAPSAYVMEIGVSGSGNNDARYGGSIAPFSVRPGEVYYYEFYAAATADCNTTVRAFLEVRDSSVTGYTWPNGTTVSPNTNWTLYSGFITIPATFVYNTVTYTPSLARIAIGTMQQATSPAGSWFITKFVVRRASSTDLIPNAAVTAAKLAANTVTSHLGYVPANKAGDTFTGQVYLDGLTTTMRTNHSTSQAHFLELRPTDYGAGKPALIFKKATVADQWDIGNWDGTNNAGTFNVISNSLTHRGFAVYTANNVGTAGSTLIGYTPANKAGDTFTNTTTVQTNLSGIFNVYGIGVGYSGGDMVTIRNDSPANSNNYIKMIANAAGTAKTFAQFRYDGANGVNIVTAASGTVAVNGNTLWDAGSFNPATKLDASAYTAADVLAKLLTVDSAGSLLDADKLDTYEATDFLRKVESATLSGAIAFSNAVTITSGTSSTSTTTGALIVTGGVGISGALNAATKSFVIPHPTKPEMTLRYGSLEGPEFGVYVRGRLKGNIIELPEYWTALVDAETITVNLTPIGKHQKLYVERVENNRVYIASERFFPAPIDCFFTVFAERKDVDKLEVES